jgi:hypothetical protein
MIELNVSSLTQFLLLGAASLVVYYIREMSNSINNLNVKVGIIIERTESHAEDLRSHEEHLVKLNQRIAFLEGREKIKED